MALARQSHSYRKRYARTAWGTTKSYLHRSARSTCVCVKAWQTLATIPTFVHLVRSTKTLPSTKTLLINSLDSTRPSCQHQFRPRRSRNVACSSRNDSLLQTALALQHLAHVRLAVRASNQIPPPRLTQRTVKTGISISTTWPTSASHYVRAAAFYDSTSAYPHQTSNCMYLHDSTYASYPHRTSSSAHLRLDHTSYRRHPSSWRLHTTATDSTHTFVKSVNKSSLLLYLLPRLCSLHCLWLSLLARMKLKSFAGSTCLSALQQLLPSNVNSCSFPPSQSLHQSGVLYI